MIHRKWSLLTGPVAVLGGVVGSVIVVNYLLFKDPFLRLKKKESESDTFTSRR
uniref:Uncharacterized protein n=1 Tax=Kalanchoe fedtschenkoi TaxID=63787 RepID=A0A7N0VAR0_KALFE